MNTNKTYYLAIDGGGTKTLVWCASNQETVIGTGTSGPMSLAATTEEKAVEHLLSAIQEATKDITPEIFEHIVIGLAGVDTPSEHQHATAVFTSALQEKYPSNKLTLVNDVVIALESGATRPNAVALISGTGSNCIGKNSSGKLAKTGGMDFLLSDQGSGFEIGQQVLRSAVKSFDGRGTRTILEKLVCEHFKIQSIEELKDKVYHPPLNKTQIAHLAKLCFQGLEKKDTKANEIIALAIEELVSMVETVMKRLDMSSEEADLILVGGIATDPYIKQMLSLQLKVRHPKLHLKVPDHPSVYGALKIATSETSIAS